jgi:hypothetical protein
MMWMAEFKVKPSGSMSVTSREVEAEGHLIDSMILPKIWDRIMELGGDFEVLEFRVGRRKTDTSYIRMLVKGQSPGHLDQILREIYLLGAVPLEVKEVTVKPAPADSVLPDDFYSTTNNETYILYD